MSLVEEINQAHAEYIERTGKTPNVAFVKIHWKDDHDESEYTEAIAIDGVDAIHDESEYTEAIAIDGVDAIHDEDILFYCNSLQGLIGLTTEGPGEDFIVTQFINFDNID